MQNPNNLPYILEGGLGDFLQFLPFVQVYPENKYILLCHFKGAKELCKALKIKPIQIEYYATEEEKPLAVGRLKQKGLPCPRIRYFDKNPFPPAKPLFTDERPVVGIHLHASKIAQFWLKKLNLQPKNLPIPIVEELAKDYNIILFGLPDDLMATKIKQSDRIKFVCFLDIAKSLSYVEQCAAVVGADSSIKTMSSMLKIPTFVWMSDHADYFRDVVFISPYVDDGVMKVFKYRNSADQFYEGMNATHEFLKGVL